MHHSEVAYGERELEFLRELEARGVPYFIGGYSAAALQGVGHAFRLDVHVERAQDPRVSAAARAAGLPHDGSGGAAHVVFDTDHHAERLAECAEIELEGRSVRVQRIEHFLDGLRAGVGDRAARFADVLRAAGREVPPDTRPRGGRRAEWTLTSSYLDRVHRVLTRARYEYRRDDTNGSYFEQLVDGAPGWGEGLHELVVVEDDARPVIDEIEREIERG